MLRHFLKIQPLKEILESQGWKESYETYTEKTISDQKLNQLLTSLSIAQTFSIRKQTSKRC